MTVLQDSQRPRIFALPWGMALVLLLWNSYFRKQMEGRTDKGVKYQAAFKKISQKLPSASHWPELKHSLAAGVAGSVIFILEPCFFGQSLGFCCSESKRVCIPGHDQMSSQCGP